MRRPTTGLVCLYGRRRLGKSRLLQELLRAEKAAAYYVADERDAALQRASLAKEMARVVPGLDRVVYPDWESLFERWWTSAPKGAVLALDEFPFLVRAAREIPSLLQKRIDGAGAEPRTLILCGSSQRMMQGLLLGPAEPLYGRAQEILRIEPLGIEHIMVAFRPASPEEAVEHYAVWGGVPRYWELAVDFPSRPKAVEALVLDPLGVLHQEPDRLLLDDMGEVARAASILSLVGQGCTRLSEIAGRLSVPATSLTRPVNRLLELSLLARDLPFGSTPRDSKRSYYRLADPFLGFWYRFVETNRSRLASGQVALIAKEIGLAWPQYLGQAWEGIARAAVARLKIAGRRWLPAGRLWGPGSDGRPLELDIVSSSPDDPNLYLVGEVKSTCTPKEEEPLLRALQEKAARCPLFAGKKLVFALFVLRGRGRARHVVGAAEICGSG